MNSFEYIAVSTPKQAVSVLKAEPDRTVGLAGGTDLLDRMKDYLISPERVVNLKQMTGLEDIKRTDDGGVSIGAIARLADVVNHKDLQSRYPAIGQAAAAVATPQIRNMATVGGNLLQRPRCWYYRNGFGLLALDKDGKSLVPRGRNEYHAIFHTGGPAYFVSPSSLAPALIAYGAQVRITGPKGERTIPVEQLYTIPKGPQDRELTIQPNEVLTHVVLPPPEANTISATYEVRFKQAHDWPMSLAAVVLKTDDAKKVRSARIILGAVAPIPWHAKDAEEAIRGQEISDETAARAADAATRGAQPLSENGYKVKLTQTAVKRAILLAAGKAYWKEA